MNLKDKHLKPYGSYSLGGMLRDNHHTACVIFTCLEYGLHFEISNVITIFNDGEAYTFREPENAKAFLLGIVNGMRTIKVQASSVEPEPEPEPKPEPPLKNKLLSLFHRK